MYTLPTIQDNAAREGPSREFQPPSARFSQVHIDLVGPLPVSSVFRYCLTAIDRYIRWPEAFPLLDHRRNNRQSLSLGCSFRLPPANYIRPGQAFRASSLQDSGYPQRVLSNPDDSMASRLQWAHRETPEAAEGRPHVPCR